MLVLSHCLEQRRKIEGMEAVDRWMRYRSKIKGDLSQLWLQGVKATKRVFLSVRSL